MQILRIYHSRCIVQVFEIMLVTEKWARTSQSPQNAMRKEYPRIQSRTFINKSPTALLAPISFGELLYILCPPICINQTPSIHPSHSSSQLIPPARAPKPHAAQSGIYISTDSHTTSNPSSAAVTAPSAGDASHRFLQTSPRPPAIVLYSS